MKGDFRVGQWLIQPTLNLICSGENRISVEPKVMEVLVYLARTPVEVHSKERIISTVWSDSFVTDDVLTHAISELRKAFGDDARSPQVIQTIPKKGYRLIAAVSSEAETISGRYRMQRRIGRGAMGEIFLVEDTLLRRKVAMKFLPEEMEQDESARRRLMREARAAAALDHPFICKVYDTGEWEGRTFIAMEYVEGETLREKLRAGPPPLAEALRIAAETAEALETAYEEGIVHRDIKPSNIMLTRQGHAKVTDFGVARRLRPPQGDEQDWTATLTKDVTTRGTLPYMSPEQLRTGEVDHRSDIFSLGVVLYEMLTGVHPFRRHAEAETTSAILTEAPPELTVQSPGIPLLLRHTVRKMLAKEPDSRYQLAHDVGTDLRELIGEIADSGSTQAAGESSAATSGRTTEPAPGRSWRQMTPRLLAAGLAGVAITLIAVWILSPAPGPPSVARLIINAAPGAPLADEPSNELAIAPDGRALAYRVMVGGRPRWYLRNLDDLIGTLLPGDHRQYPIFSPDGASLAVLKDGTLAKVALTGGDPVAISEAGLSLARFSGAQRSTMPEYIQGSWGSDDNIVITAFGGRVLYRVSAHGGEPEVVLTSTEDERYFWPHILPGGRAVLLHMWDGAERDRIVVLELETGEKKVLLEGGSQPFFASTGHLLYSAWTNGTLMAVPFDPKALKVRGEPIAVQRGIRSPGTGGSTGRAMDFALSSNGTLVYVPDTGATYDLAWFDRSGKRLGSMGEPGPYGQIALSADDQRVVVERLENGNWDLWLLELSSGILSRLTRDPALDRDPTWSPDGSRIVFSSARQGTKSLFEKDLSTGREELLLTFEDLARSLGPPYWNRDIVPDDWTLDGRFVIFRDVGRSVYALPLDGERKPRLLIDTPYLEDQLHVSPDGRWIAFGTDESERWEVYVASFPDFTQKRQISRSGGVQPLWRMDGRELFYLTLDGKMMIVETQSGETFQAGIPKVLFGTGLQSPNTSLHEYCVTGDGQRFLVREAAESAGASDIIVVLNWFEELKRLVRRGQSR